VIAVAIVNIDETQEYCLTFLTSQAIIQTIMGEEHPPLGKTFIQSLDQNDYNYPVVSILKDPRLAGYKLPTDLSPHPDTLRYPSYYLTTVTFPSPSDQRVYWMYNRIAGAVMTVKDKNDDGTVLTITKQLQFAADIVCGESVTGATVGSKVWTRVTQEHQSFGVATKITETRAINGQPVYRYDIDDETSTEIEIVSTVIEVSEYVGNDDSNDGTQVTLNPIDGSSLIAKRIVTTYNGLDVDVLSTKLNDDGTVLSITKRLVLSADAEAADCGESVTGATVGSKVWSKVTANHKYHGVSVLITESREIDGTKVYKYDSDAETFQTVTIISEVVVVADYDEDFFEAGTEFSLNPIVGSSLIATKISAAIGGRVVVEGVPNYSLLDRTEYSIAPYNILSCIFSWTAGSFVALDGSVGINFNFNKSGSFSTPCLHEITVEYFITAPNPIDAEALIPIDIVYDGIFAKVNQQNVMCDELLVFAFNTDDDNPKWGLASENFGPYGPSNPTATEYVALLDAGLPISSTVKPWKYNLWRRESVKVFFPTPVP
jgi:hypothetical protein